MTATLKPPLRATLLASVVAAGFVCAGCMSWTPGWKAPVPPRGAGEVEAALQRADALFEVADDAAQLRAAIAAYDTALQALPVGSDGRLPVAAARPLTQLAEAHVLFGAAYAQGKPEKARSYITGIRYAEQAMACVPAFRRRVEAGASISEAVAELGREQMRPMLFWVTGVSFYFKECLRAPSHLWNFRWMLRTREVMTRMMEVDPEAEHGAVPFSLAIYYLGLPKSAGGDLGRSAELLAQAEAQAPGALLTRWGRAKYLYVRTGDRAGFQRDLEWVLAQDPRREDGQYRWNVYFQRDAREMLSRIDRWF